MIQLGRANWEDWKMRIAADEADAGFEDYRVRVDEGTECPSCHARSYSKPFYFDGDAFNCPICRLRFNRWLRSPNGLYRDPPKDRPL